LPVPLAALAVIAAIFLVLPMIALALRTPWSSFGELVTRDQMRAALAVSLVSSSLSLVLATVLGVPLAWLLARVEFPGKELLRALTILPMVLPPVVGGIALLLAFGRRGLVGAPIAALTGVTFPFTLAGVVLAGTFVSMPFVVLTVEAALRALDPRYDEAAASLGATPAYTIRRVTLPMIAPSLLAGMALCWTRALGEFGATITFAGNLPGRTQTMPLAAYVALESDEAMAYLLSFVLLLASAAVMIALRGRVLGPR
jgi:molybdate transport system permease protein